MGIISDAMGKALRGAGAGIAQVSLIELNNQALEMRERRLAEFEAKRKAGARETFGPMEPIMGAPEGTMGQRSNLSGKYENIQQTRNPIEVADPESPSGTRWEDPRRAIGQPGKGWADRKNQRDEKILDLVLRGFSNNDASDIVDGYVDLTHPDAFGDFYIINKATGARTKVGDSRGPIRRDAVQAPGGPIRPPGGGLDLDAAAMEGSGPFAALRQGANNVLGPFVTGQPFPQTEAARNTLRLFGQEVKQSLVNSDRFPVHEQKLVESMLPSPDRFLTDPDGELEKIRQLQRFLVEKRTQNGRTLQDGRITQKDRGILVDQNAAIDRTLGMMGPISQRTPVSGQSGRNSASGIRFLGFE